MDTIKKLFPYSFKASTVKDLIVTIVVYLIADVVCGFIIGLLGHLPLLGWLFSIVGWLAGIYFFVGIVLAVLNFLGVLKK